MMATQSAAQAPEFVRRSSRWGASWQRVAVLTPPAIILGLFFVAGVFADLLSAYDPEKIVLVDRLIPPVMQEGGSWAHPLGTDNLGRDILSRIIYGARVSLLVVGICIPALGVHRCADRPDRGLATRLGGQNFDAVGGHSVGAAGDSVCAADCRRLRQQSAQRHPDHHRLHLVQLRAPCAGRCAPRCASRSLSSLHSPAGPATSACSSDTSCPTSSTRS